MRLDLIRRSDNGNSTLGDLYIDGSFVCYILEDEYRHRKVPGETRIPSGEYEIALRTEGGFHARYTRKFGRMHKGMLHVLDVEGFQWILIHTGNHDKHTRGCILLGDTCNNNTIAPGFIGKSVQAYKRVYPRIAKALVRDELVILGIYDSPFFQSPNPNSGGVV